MDPQLLKRPLLTLIWACVGRCRSQVVEHDLEQKHMRSVLVQRPTARAGPGGRQARLLGASAGWSVRSCSVGTGGCTGKFYTCCRSSSGTSAISYNRKPTAIFALTIQTYGQRRGVWGCSYFVRGGCGMRGKTKSWPCH